jgi:pimeloyl-ACP methyl ester carboxylesterase
MSFSRRAKVANSSPAALHPETTIRLPDGRRLGYAAFGDSAGFPVFFFHGGGDSRFQRHADDAATAALGIRLITTDRPGVGLSDFKPRRRVSDWADDTAALADHLHLDRFAVLGYSLGGPHALACAYKLPNRLTCAGVVSGVAPIARPGGLDGMSSFARRLFHYARRSSHLTRLPIYLMGRQVRRDAAAFLDGLYADAPEHDRMVYGTPGRRDNQIAATREAARQGSRGLAHELSMVARPWDFRLEDIRVPVLLWYGTADHTTPPSMAHYLAATIPHSHLTWWPNEGHQALFVHWSEILATLRKTETGQARSGE